MGKIFLSLIIMTILIIYLFGWWGVVGVVLFLLGSYHCMISGEKLGPIGRFIEKLGVDETIIKK